MSEETQPEKKPASFTGRGRRKTSRRVKVTDKAMRTLITVGGWGVVAAFIGIVVYIASVAVPLFRSPDISERIDTDLPVTADAGQPLGFGVDEDLANLWAVYGDGTLQNYAVTTGEISGRQELSDLPVTAASIGRSTLALGRSDGSVLMGSIRWNGEYITELSDAMETLLPGHTMVADGSVIMIDQAGNHRAIKARAELNPPVQIGGEDLPPSPIVLVDYQVNERLEVMVAMREDGQMFFTEISKRFNLMQNRNIIDTADYTLPVDENRRGQTPVALLLGINGEQVFVVYKDGHMVRYNTRDRARARIAERMELLPDSDAEVTAVRMLLGNGTIIVGDSAGGVTGWLPVANADAQTEDGLILVRAHTLESHKTPVRAIAISSRDRQFITGDDSGELIIHHMTSAKTQAHLQLNAGQQIGSLLMAPKNDAILSLSQSKALQLWDFDNPHADGSMRAMFAPIQYEGYPKATMVYQSSASLDSAEPKYSLWPLILGTLKATFYAMLFATPIAIMAAIYSSEFMSPKVRATVKPTIELMASLPSVVLGFIGALVLAPLVEKWLAAVLMTFVAIPVAVVSFGFLWQLLPPRVGRMVPPWAKFALMCVTVLLASVVAAYIAPGVERVLFPSEERVVIGGQEITRTVGDLHGWLDSRHGSATPGWFLLLVPIVAIGLSIVYARWIKPALNIQDRFESAGAVALFDICRLLAIALLSLALAWLAGMVLTSMGFDLRGTLIGSYAQRNTLIVGIIMGFAIIPIIYTVSEDALSSVPASLRSASLGAGATPWQTAVRVVLPVATSGIFSACMIGFGRAAGETMIVLMASGGTPLWGDDAMSIFNGLRALSANIAVELPEAAKGSTHFRILFFSAVLLFLITFVVNTVAEVVRIRFRKRTVQL